MSRARSGGGAGAGLLCCLILPLDEALRGRESLPPGPLAALSDNVENRPGRPASYQPPGRSPARRGTPRGFFLDRYVY